ncbi:ESPR-type extended signal peptide-containing protein, partial [Burkholderia sp. MSMB2157WGS]|uniref:ESPR-type extended signal peptide-containing protein n=1 Tax=Burkholderia sp. MSMB2157WGS TaxID=1637928 RepID=UPI0012E358EC
MSNETTTRRSVHVAFSSQNCQASSYSDGSYKNSRGVSRRLIIEIAREKYIAPCNKGFVSLSFAHEAINMNKTYRTVWNASTGTWAAAEETARSKTKGSSRVARKALAAVALGGMAIGGASAADVVGASDGAESKVDDESVIQTPITSTKSLMPMGTTSTESVGTTAALDNVNSRIATLGNGVAGTTTDIGLMGGLDGGTASGTNIAVGSGSTVRQAGRFVPTYGIAIGIDALVTDGDIQGATGSIAIGHSAGTGGAGSIAVGESASTNGSGSVAVGRSAYTQRGVAVGNAARGNANGSTALGNSATSNGTNSVALGDGSLADRSSSVSVGSATLQRQITNVAAGTQANDAVVLSQLTPVVNALGGGASIDATTGAVTGPTYDLTNGGRQTTVGGALTALDGAVTASNQSIGDLRDSLKNGGVIDPTTGESLAVTYDDATKAGITLGNAGTPVAIRNVAAGDVSATSTDAVNGSQLFATNTRVGSLEDSLKNGGVIDPTTGESLSVVYDSAAKNHVTLGGAGASSPVVLSNVAQGVAGTDAVNVDQLNAAVAAGGGANPYIGGRGTGVAAQATGINAVALGLGSLANEINTISVGNSTTGLQRRITNVADGQGDHDAATIGQVNNLVGGATSTMTAAIDDVNNRISTLSDGIGTMAALDDAYIKVRTGSYAPATEAVAGTGAIAIGGGATASGLSNMALGGAALANAQNAIALGTLSRATGSETVALGVGANAAVDYTTAVGRAASATGGGAIALGYAASASGGGAMALGNSTNASANGAIALGSSSVADRANTVSVGTTTSRRQIVNVAAGTQANDAVVLSQLTPVVTALGGGASINATTGAVTGPTYNLTNGGRQTTVGGALTALDGALTTANGNITTINNRLATAVDNRFIKVNGSADAAANTINSIAIGSGAVAGVSGDSTFTHQVAIGPGATAQGLSSVSVGSGANSNGTGAVGIGRGSAAIGNAAMALGNLASAQARNSIALGDRANVNAGATDSVAIGSQAGIDENVTNSVALGAGATATRNNTVSVGSATQQRQITNVAAGTQDTDAVNVGQLKGSGLIGDDGQGNLTSLAVTYDDATKAGITLGNAGTPVAIHNVAAGNLSATSTDAVNGSQLFATNQSIGDLSDSLKNGGVIDPTTGQSLAVVYDSVAKNHVTLGGVGASNPVVLSNVAQGVAGTDAVNVDQLNAAIAAGGGSGANPYIGGRGTGVAAQATGINAVALGLGSLANEINTISVGNSTTGLQRRITNVADGQGDHDAATIGQVNNLVGGATSTMTAAIDDVNNRISTLSDGIGTMAALDDAYVKVDGQRDGSDNASVAANSFGVAIGAEANASGTTAVAVGPQATSSGTASVALGAGASATRDNAVALGGSSSVSGANAIGVGAGTVASQNSAVAMGFNARALAANAVALGSTASAAAADSLAFGTLSRVNAGATDSVAIGRGATVAGAAQNSVALGAGSAADRLNSIAVGSSGQQRQIIYVARGTAATDAVNVSQLRDAVAAFGGNAAVGADGSIVNPTYTVGGTTYHNVGDALNALAQQGPGGSDPLAVTYAQNTDGTPNFDLVTLKGGANGTKITNVAAGAVNATSTDAINGSQLYGTAQSVADALGGGSTVGADGTVTNPTYSLADPADASQKQDYHNVGDALANLDDRTSQNTGDIGDLKDKLSDTGLVDGNGDTRAVVTYDKNADGTPNYGSVTLGDGSGPVKVTNVADATGDSDAVNLGQLKGSGLVGEDGQGNLTSLAVTYDDATKAGITLGNAGTPVAIHNVAAGDVSATSTDAVNGSQLFATNQSIGDLSDSLKNGGVIDPTTGESLAVVYDGASKDKVTLAGANGTTLSNVKAGVADMDAVNVGQLKDSGLVGDDGQGNLTSLAVTYDDATKAGVTLGNAGTPVAIHNVAAGDLSATSTDAVNGSQLFMTNTRVGSMEDWLNNSGLVDPVTGQSLAVVYDSGAKDTVTLGDGNGPVKVTNVADATGDSDAVNLGQLKDSGLVGEDGQGNLTSLAVTYDDATKAGITLGNAGTPVAIHNVAAGDVSATSTDAVNGSQLFATNQSIGDLSDSLKNGGVIDPITGQSLAVTYDSAAKDTVTLGGAGATTPVQLKNVAAGTDDTDAVNVAQLKDTGLVGEDGQGNLTSLAVTYDDATKAGITLGNAGTPVAIHNVAAGDLSATSTDAVNGSQLFATNQSIGDLSDSLKDGGVIDPTTGQSLAVVYDSAAKDTVTLGGAGATTPVQLKNVAAGTDDTDAVNVAQLKDAGLVAPIDPTNPGSGLASLAVTYDKNADGSANFDQIALKGGANGTKITNVAAGDLSATSTDAVNGSQLFATNTRVGSLEDSLNNSGLIDPVTGQSLAVTYDSAAKDTVTLGDGNGPVKVTNVADATGDSDAVNLGQLKGSGLVGEDGQGNLTSLAVTYDDATKAGITLG